MADRYIMNSNCRYNGYGNAWLLKSGYKSSQPFRGIVNSNCQHCKYAHSHQSFRLRIFSLHIFDFPYFMGVFAWRNQFVDDCDDQHSAEKSSNSDPTAYTMSHLSDQCFLCFKENFNHGNIDYNTGRKA